MEEREELVVPGFGVYDQWGPLKEVIIGRADTFRYGAWNDVYDVARDEFREKWKQNEGRLVSDVWPEYVNGFEEELESIGNVLRTNGVQVERARPLTRLEIDSDPMPAAHGVWQCSPADAQWVVGRNYIETSMRIALPRKNYLWARDAFLPKIEKIPDARWLSSPRSAVTWDPLTGTGPYLDGGDIVMLGNGRDVLVGVDDASTDAWGARWLSDTLAADGYRVWPMTFNRFEVHLCAQLNLVGPNLMIWCPEAFEGHPPFPEPLRRRMEDPDFHTIEITKEEVHDGGADIVMIHEKLAVVSAKNPKVVEALKGYGIESCTVDLSWALQATSGVRCCMVVVHREPGTRSTIL